MKKLPKGTLSIKRILIYAFLLLIAGVLLFVDLKDFRPEVESIVKNKTGRTINIIGKFELSFFPEFKISLGETVLNNPSYFPDKKFAELTEAQIKVKLLSLFSGKIEIEPVLVRGLMIHLCKNSQSGNNWDDLIKTHEKDDTDDVKRNLNKALALFNFNGFKLEQSRLFFEDQSTGSKLDFTNLHLTIDRLRPDQPIPLLLGFSVYQNSPKLAENIQLTTDLYTDAELDTVKFKSLKLTSISQVEPQSIFNLSANTITYQWPEQTLAILGIHLEHDPLIIRADFNGAQTKENFILQGAVQVPEFKLKQLLEKWHVELPNSQDKSVFSRLSADFKLQAGQHAVLFNNISVILDQTTFKGDGEIRDFANPLMRFTLAADKLDLDRYLTAKSNTTTQNQHLTPAAVLAAQMESLGSPIQQLIPLRVEGQLAIEQLNVSQISMQGVTLELR